MKNMNKLIIIFVVLVLASTIAIAPPPGPPALKGADFAIYVDAGTWQPSIAAFKEVLEWKGLTWEEVLASHVNSVNLTPLYKGIYFPGGWAPDYNQKIKTSGYQNIRNFINSGGAYIGVSAGAYFACDKIVWESVNYDYPLNLFGGNCIGPISEIAPWPDYVMTTMDINQSHPANAFEPSQRTVYYQGEPYFVPYAGQEMLTMARYSVPSNPSVDNTPGIISYNYGQGRVVLSGPHLELEEDSDRDNTTYAAGLADGLHDHSDWPFLWTALDWDLKRTITQSPQDDPSRDTLAPSVTNVVDSPDPVTVGIPVTISATLTDASNGFDWPAVSTARVTINGVNYTMSRQSGGAGTLFFDDFEASDLRWVVTSVSGRPWNLSTLNPFAGSKHAQSRNSGDGVDNKPTRMEVSVSTAASSGITVSYYRKLIGIDAWDTWQAEWFDGSSWNTLELVNKNTDDSAYVFKSFNLPSSANNNQNLKLRFTCETAWDSEYCRLDNVKVEASAAASDTWSYTHDTTGMASGTYAYIVNARDAEGNFADASESFTVQ